VVQDVIAAKVNHFCYNALLHETRDVAGDWNLLTTLRINFLSSFFCRWKRRVQRRAAKVVPDSSEDEKDAGVG